MLKGFRNISWAFSCTNSFSDESGPLTLLIVIPLNVVRFWLRSQNTVLNMVGPQLMVICVLVTLECEHGYFIGSNRMTAECNWNGFGCHSQLEKGPKVWSSLAFLLFPISFGRTTFLKEWLIYRTWQKYRTLQLCSEKIERALAKELPTTGANRNKNILPWIHEHHEYIDVRCTLWVSFLVVVMNWVPLLLLIATSTNKRWLTGNSQGRSHQTPHGLSNAETS